MCVETTLTNVRSFALVSLAMHPAGINGEEVKHNCHSVTKRATCHETAKRLVWQENYREYMKTLMNTVGNLLFTCYNVHPRHLLMLSDLTKPSMLTKGTCSFSMVESICRMPAMTET